jgi:DNA-binding CsgD family transcriptional regulator
MRSAIETHPANELQDVLRIVDAIYGAGCGESGWDRALGEVCRAGRLGGAALVAVEPLDQRRTVLASAGLGDDAGSGATLPSILVMTDDVLGSTPGAVWQDRQIMAPQLLATTRFWTGWMRPRGFGSWSCVIVGKDRDRVVCLEVYGRSTSATAEPRSAHLLRQLAPHLCRAWRLSGPDRSMPTEGATSNTRAPLSAMAPTSAMVEVGRLRARFGLTKAEARLALRLAEGASLANAAQAFDVKMTTIRSQLQQVFAKTETSRQAELVALLLGREGP